MLVGNAAYEPVSNTYELIDTYVLAGSSSSINFNNLNNYSSIYKHFEIRYVARGDRANQEEFFYIRFNGDSGANYTSHYAVATGSIFVSGTNTSSYPNGVVIGAGTTGANSPANSFGSGIVEILEPYSTNKNKTVRIIDGFINTTYNRYGIEGGAWLSNTSVSSISLVPIFGANFVQGSRFSLYGVRGSNA